MCRPFLMVSCLALLIAHRSFAEETNLHGAPRPAPVRALTSGSSGDASDKSPDKTVDHLLKAAEHLDAAGLPEQAARLRNDARRRALRDDLLGRKESELECLQEEVDRLRELTGQATAVRIEIVAVDIDRTALGLNSGDFDKMIGLAGHPALGALGDSSSVERATFGIVEANPARLPLFKELVEKGVLSVVARPNLLTSAGRPAAMHLDREIPMKVEISAGEVSVRNVPIGMHVEVLPLVLPNRRVRLRLAIEKCGINSDKTSGDEVKSNPELQSRRINTEVEMTLGQTVTLAGFNLERRREAGAPTNGSGERKAPGSTVARSIDRSGATQTIIFITPEFVHSPIRPRALHVLPETESEDESADFIEPAVFEPVDWDLFGPPVPVLRRRTSRD